MKVDKLSKTSDESLISIKEELNLEIDRLRKKYSERSSSGLREEFFSWDGEKKLLITGKTYDVILRKFPFGERVCLIRKNQDEYEDLQSLRNQWWHYENADDAIEGQREKFKNSESISSGNALRAQELEELINHSDVNITGSKFCEIGFRHPELMIFWKERGIELTGYDIVKYSVLISQYLGYDARHADLNSDDLDLSGYAVVMSYQVLEHVTDPQAAINRIYESMDSGSYFHVEIPIEPGFPRLEWGHLYPFHENDIENMLFLAGFKILYPTSNVWEDGPLIRRVFCLKE